MIVCSMNQLLSVSDNDTLFGDPARTALAAILPDGQHTTYGFEPLPEDAYVEYEGNYYQTANVITGRKQMERTLVRAEPLPETADVPDDAILVDELSQPTARVVKILHNNAVTDGKGSSAELLRGDAYVLRRPVERESRLATGDLDGRVVTMTDGGSWAYRLTVTHERITETAHTGLAIEVANSRPQFRDVVFGSRIDVELTPENLSADVRSLLEDAVRQEAYEETVPLSETFEALLTALGLKAVDKAVNGKLL